MPIGSIINQPAANSVYAAYRPIVLRVLATKTNGDAIPPIVFCDVYINGLFYKTFSSTQYAKLNLTNTEWEFDIQDSLQESLNRYLATNGGSSIVNATSPICSVYCKFRSSGIDTEGFLQPEGTEPIQGTYGVDPVAGTGTQSNTFFVVNATLQHEDNQNIIAHLDTFKQRTWNTDSHPLTHRPEGYKICIAQSDYFPILSLKEPRDLTLNYRNRNSSTFLQLGYNGPCGTALSFLSSEALPDGAIGNPYYFAISLEGTLPITLSNITKPAWMTIAVNAAGTLLEFTGTPNAGGTNIPVSLTVSNCCDTVNLVIDELIDIASCVNASFAGAVTLPDAVLNTPYVYDINLNGTQPFTLSNVVKPDWMTITVVGSQVQLRGTPDESDFGTNIPVSFDITNCGATINVNQTIDLPGGVACGGLIDVNTASGLYVDLGFYYLNIASGTTNVALQWSTGERPNRITLYKDNAILETTGWKGYANYGGPWGSSLNTVQSGTINFAPVAGSGYKVRIEVGNWDPLNPQSDNVQVNVVCS